MVEQEKCSYTMQLHPALYSRPNEALHQLCVSGKWKMNWYKDEWLAMRRAATFDSSDETFLG